MRSFLILTLLVPTLSFAQPMDVHNNPTSNGIQVKNPLLAELLWQKLSPYADANHLIKKSFGPRYFTINDVISCEENQAGTRSWYRCFISDDRWNSANMAYQNSYSISAEPTGNNIANVLWQAFDAPIEPYGTGEEEEVKQIALPSLPSRTVFFTEENSLACFRRISDQLVTRCTFYNQVFKRQL